jgi:hypothetical protein
MKGDKIMDKRTNYPPPIDTMFFDVFEVVAESTPEICVIGLVRVCGRLLG